MNEQKNILKPKFAGRSTTKTETQQYRQTPPLAAKKAVFFGLEKGNRFVRRFKLYFRDERMISVPYAYLPIILYDPTRPLTIKTADIEITIQGRALQTLADWLSEEKVLWIKESPSGIDDQTSAVFVSNIEIDGELIG